MRGPMGKVPEGLLSRNECIELLGVGGGGDGGGGGGGGDSDD